MHEVGIAVSSDPQSASLKGRKFLPGEFCSKNARTEIPERLLAFLSGRLRGRPRSEVTWMPSENIINWRWTCLNLAEAARDPATQGQMLRLAEFCARLADDSENNKASSHRTDHDQAA
jgi:hypothetical protein